MISVNSLEKNTDSIQAQTMRVLYAKRFEKDLDAIKHDARVKRRLIESIEGLKQADSI